MAMFLRKQRFSILLYMKIFIALYFSLFFNSADYSDVSEKHEVVINTDAYQLYQQLNNESLPFEPFNMAYQAYFKLKDSLGLKENIISVVDFSQASTQKRFYLIDMDAKKVLYQNYVAHGKNTGVLNATRFSNILHSNQSSLGFFKTGETYYGKHGLSLKLDGLEKGINHLARKRHIVIHSASYAEESFIKKYGRLGRSFGCPALPSENYAEVIELIKNGTLLFIYSQQTNYLELSELGN